MSEPLFLTHDVPGTGGRIRERLEDFVVEEIPLYEASGVGEHLYLTVQKSGISTPDAIRRIAKALRVPDRKIGYAGLKDARAISRQIFSVQGVREGAVRDLSLPGVEVISAKRHRNKLRIGHLRGNRFLIRLRGLGAEAAENAEAAIARLAREGVPNRFGAQRFGSKGDAHRVGRALVRREPEEAVQALLGESGDRERDPRLLEARRRFAEGDFEGAMQAFPGAFQAERRVLDALRRGSAAEDAIRRIPKGTLRIVVSAYQSWLFNRLLEARMPFLGTLLEGDLAYLHDRGAVFRVEDPAVEQPRADAFEISPSAPLFGRKVTLADGVPGDEERAMLEAEEVSLEDFRLPGVRSDGERRAMRVPLGSPGVRPEGEDAILLSFDLPKGSYATAVLREVMKVPDPDSPEVRP